MASTVDKSNPRVPLASLVDDRGYKNGEATSTCLCGAVQLAFVSQPIASPLKTDFVQTISRLRDLGSVSPSFAIVVTAGPYFSICPVLRNHCALIVFHGCIPGLYGNIQQEDTCIYVCIQLHHR